jgi:hypothetical protein
MHMANDAQDYAHWHHHHIIRMHQQLASIVAGAVASALPTEWMLQSWVCFA